VILRVVFNKKNYLRYLGHLDVMRLFQRSFGRAGISIKHSEGFNPHPKFSIGNPLSLGIESEEEYMDIDLEDKIPAEDFIIRMNDVLPQDIQIIKGAYLKKEESLVSLITWAFYEMKFVIVEERNKEYLEEVFNNWLLKEEIIITRLRKKGKRKVESKENIKGLIGNLVIKNIKENIIIIEVLLRTGERGNLRPNDFIDAMNRDVNLGINLDSIVMKRLGLYAEKDNNIYKPL